MSVIAEEPAEKKSQSDITFDNIEDNLWAVSCIYYTFKYDRYLQKKIMLFLVLSLLVKPFFYYPIRPKRIFSFDHVSCTKKSTTTANRFKPASTSISYTAIPSIACNGNATTTIASGSRRIPVTGMPPRKCWTARPIDEQRECERITRTTRGRNELLRRQIGRNRCPTGWWKRTGIHIWP